MSLRGNKLELWTSVMNLMCKMNPLAMM